MAYATVDDVRTLMGHDEFRRAETVDAIDGLLEAATKTIDADTGRVFAATSATRTFGSPDRYSCHLTLPDFTAITALKVDDDDDGTFEVTIASSGYELDGPELADWPYDTIRLLDRHWPHGGRRRRRIEIQATWGWSAVPQPIVKACALLAMRYAKRMEAAPLGVQSFGDVGAAMIRSSDPDYRHLIGPYRRPQVA